MVTIRHVETPAAGGGTAGAGAGAGGGAGGGIPLAMDTWERDVFGMAGAATASNAGGRDSFVTPGTRVGGGIVDPFSAGDGGGGLGISHQTPLEGRLLEYPAPTKDGC